MINPNNPLTLIEAAKLMGVSTQTVRRLIQREILTAQQSHGPHGLRWEIERTEILRYLNINKAEVQPQQPLSTPHVSPYQHPNNTATEPPQNNLPEINNPYQRVDHGQHEPQQPQQEQSVPLAAHLAALELARAQLDHLQRQAEEAQRAVIQAERAKISLEAQLGQYQRVLSEQAESLAEERAHRMALEASKIQAATIQTAPPLPEVELKVATVRPGWGGRLRRWLGLAKQDTA